ncbi:MAG: enoyl-CoA hydratase/isomerase family protein [Rhodoferax sp.]|nr:enoyl-CoA hydratase/isomerase family protein [Rhodoferax sp.]
MSDIPELLMARHGAVALVTLNRPEVGNAINDAIRTGLPQALEALDQDPDCAVVVMAGAGAKGFCVGADIKESRTVGHPVQERQRLLGNPWIDRVARLRKPVIAAIDGFCLGGGLELALACDIRMATARAQFALPETGLGLIPGGGGTQRLARVIGLGRALDLILSGERIDAVQASQMGLVTRVVGEPGDLLASALSLAERIAQRPPTASAFAKEATRQGLEMTLEDGLRLEKSLFSMLMTTADRAEAARAFREKRPPRFSGA